MNSTKVISFGEALIDRLGPLGGDPSIDKPVTNCFGGAPANVACALSRLGVDVTFIGALGNDSFGHDFKNLIIDREINTIGLQEDKLRPTRIVLVRRDLSGERTFGGFAGEKGFGFADQAISLDQIVKDWPLISDQAKWLVIGTIPMASKISAEAFAWCIQKANTQGIKIVLDLNWRPTFWRSKLSKEEAPFTQEVNTIQPILNKVSLIKLAKEEAQWFFKSVNPQEISLKMPHKPSVIVTDGANPVHWFINKNLGNTNSISPPKIVDTTGAGDAFTAGLIYKLLSAELDCLTYKMAEEIIRFAIGCGAYVCQGIGAIDSQPYLEDIDNLLSLSKGGIS